MATELNKFTLGAMAIIGLTVVILVGIAISSAFSKELRASTTINASESTAATVLINESIAVGSSGTYPFLQELTGCFNATSGLTDELLTSYYSINEGDKDGGSIALNQDGVAWNGTSINCSNIGYLANSAGQSAADNFTSGLAIFGTFSVILILAIVGKAIIGLFKKVG